jgi:CheY-like chemotaxis protein
VTLLLPRAAAETGAAATPAPPMPAPPALRVLLVEDDDEVAEATVALLEASGMQVVRADSGETALELLECDPAIDLVLSDVVMAGGINGLDLARTLRQRRPGLPILLATGYSRYGAQAIGEGFTLIEKPFGREGLAAAIHNAISRTRREPAG